MAAWLVARGLIPGTSPKRVFAAATFVNQRGKGLFIAGAALFFTRSVGLPVSQVGLALGAALIGLAAGIPVGRLADRRGPREVFRLAVVVQALAVAGLVFVQSFLSLVACVCVVELATPARRPSRAHRRAALVRRRERRGQHRPRGLPAGTGQPRCGQQRVGRAGGAPRRGAFLLATALIAAAGGAPGWAAVVVIVLGVVVHTVGELWHAAASFELSFGLAPEHAQGQYSGLFAIGQGLSNAVGPPLLGVLCLGWGGPGWLVVGALLLVVGQFVPLVVSWSDRLRVHSPG
ncbi:MFS transporter [Streptomyces sp. RK9]|uniref:MFS transporter n=1 Tax=Streptomyces sp. RK9 TaxID=3239284 RepID=UPI00386A495D